MSTETEILSSLIKKAINSVQGPTLYTVKLEHPQNPEFGDYSVNLARFPQARELAQKVKESLEKQKLEFIGKVSIVGVFVNISINPTYLITCAQKVLKDKNYGKLPEKKQKIMVEFAHPNTHKLFHIGHLRNITTGESIVRILEAAGFKVIRANYQGDVGLHIAKCLWTITKRFKIYDLRFKNLDEKIKFLGDCYSQGHNAYEENENTKKEIININKKIYDRSDENINKLWQETRSWSLEYFARIYKRVYSHFDRYYFESEVFKTGKELVLKNLGKVFEKSQGAIIFPGKKFGLHDRVFINSEGNATYEGKDVGLCQLQFEEYNPDKIIHVVAPEQASYFQVLFKSLEQVFPQTKGREQHLKYGWVRLKEGKMSSREGKVILGEWLVDEVKKKIKEIMLQVQKTAVEDKDLEKVSETVSIAAVKYSFLKQGVDKDLAFDINESVSLQGNSGPYLLYTYARCKSVLSKANYKNYKIYNNYEINPEELSVLRTLYRYPEVVELAGQNLNPSLICTYLYDLAGLYNTFYNKHSILNAETAKDLRLLLTTSTAQILQNGLDLLGIKTVEKM